MKLTGLGASRSAFSLAHYEVLLVLGYWTSVSVEHWLGNIFAGQVKDAWSSKQWGKNIHVQRQGGNWPMLGIGEGKRGWRPVSTQQSFAFPFFFWASAEAKVNEPLKKNWPWKIGASGSLLIATIVCNKISQKMNDSFSSFQGYVSFVAPI